MIMDHKETLLKAIDHFGADNQALKAIEELSELIQAICKTSRSQIQEEIADVLIMIRQIMMIFVIQDQDINKMIEFKIERLKNRMEGINEDNF